MGNYKKSKEDLINEAKYKMKKVCPHCGRKMHFYAFEKKGKQLCDWCGRYVFKDNQTEFKYRVKEIMRREKDGNTGTIK